MTHSAIASCSTFLFLPHFDVVCDLLPNRRTATWSLFINLKYGRYRARPRRRRRRRRGGHRRRRRLAYAPTSNTHSHDNHEKINSRVSFSFLYEYGAALWSPWGRLSCAINLLVSYYECRSLIGYATHYLFCNR